MSIHEEFTAESAIHTWELIELGGMERGTQESAALMEALGEPVEGTPLDRSTLPLIIVGYDPRRLTEVLFRQRADPETALRPIAVAGIQDASDAPFIDQLADVVIAPHPPGRELSRDISALEEILQRLEPMPLGSDDGALRLLQFLESRRSPLRPVLDPAARMAYRYPVAERMFGTGASQVLELLVDMARYGMLERKTVDRVHVCPDCGGYRIPVKETCPECMSPDVSIETSIHHFRCGYMAPEMLFRKDGYMECPKCQDMLRHVGVEYNRPGQLAVCGSCGFWASEPKLQAWCVDCNRLHDPEKIRTVRVHRFSQTSAARKVARAGSWNPSRGYINAPQSASGSDNGGGLEARRDESSQPESEDARGSDSDSRLDDPMLIRRLIDMAENQAWPLSIFLVRVQIPSDARSERYRWVRAAESALRRSLGKSDLMARVGSGSFLLLRPESEQKPAPDARDIEQWMQKRMSVSFRIRRIDSREALELMESGGR